jgi:hypothetical protein
VQDWICLAKQSLHRIEESRRLGDAAFSEQLHHVRPERREKFAIAGR